MPETKHNNTYLNKKINEAIKFLLNEMSVHSDNSVDEDVSLPEILDRLTTRVNSTIEATNQAVEEIRVIQDTIEKDYASRIEFYPSISKFPKESDVRIDTIYVNKSDFTMYMWDDTAHSYAPIGFDATTRELTTDDIQRVVKIIDGGTASTNI